MIFINEVSFIYDSERHQKNVEIIKGVFLNLFGSKYKSCAYKVRNIVITNNLKSTAEKYNYNDLNENAIAITSRIGSLNDIIVNYNNCIWGREEDCFLSDMVPCCVCHELQHIRDRIKYDGFIVNYCNERNISHNQKVIGEMIFREFNAQFQGQSYDPIIWEYNKYSLETNAEKYHIKFVDIEERIKKLKNLKMVEEQIEELAKEVLDFTRNLMYDMSISFGSNAADNKREKGEKYIDIVVGEIDTGVDAVLNDFIGFNKKIRNNEELIIYSLEHSLVVYDFINEIFIKTIRQLEQ